MIIPIPSIQTEVGTWATKNFGADRPAYQRLLGAMEELGELSHAHLKEEQNIRGTEDHVADAKDAIGDIVIYLMDYCTRCLITGLWVASSPSGSSM